jgi:hypothetical protein
MTNIRLTYDYTLNSIKVIKENIDKINTKLAIILTLSGVLVNFGKDLPGDSIIVTCLDYPYPCRMCYLLKLLAYLLIIITIALGLWGLYPATGGQIILPEQLLEDEWNLADEEDYLTALVQYLEQETLLVLSKIEDQQQTRLNWAILTIAAAIILLGLDEILAISIPVLGNFCS